MGRPQATREQATWMSRRRSQPIVMRRLGVTWAPRRADAPSVNASNPVRHNRWYCRTGTLTNPAAASVRRPRTKHEVGFVRTPAPRSGPGRIQDASQRSFCRVICSTKTECPPPLAGAALSDVR